MPRSTTRRSTPTRSSAPIAAAALRWEALVDAARKAGSSLGAVIACEATGRARRLGRAALCQARRRTRRACMGINAVKGVEIGDGFAAAALSGEAECRSRCGRATDGPAFLANHAGGIAGGIATGQPIRLRVAFKPTSSILTAGRDDHPRRRGDRDRDQGPARPLRRHPRRAGGRGDGGAGAGRPEAAAPRAMRLSATVQ